VVRGEPSSLYPYTASESELESDLDACASCNLLALVNLGELSACLRWSPAEPIHGAMFVAVKSVSP